MIVFGWRNPCYLDDSVLFSFSSFLSSFSSFFLLFLCLLLFLFSFQWAMIWIDRTQLHVYLDVRISNAWKWEGSLLIINPVYHDQTKHGSHFLFLSLLGDPDQSSTRSNTERVEAIAVDNQTCVSRANVARPILVNPYLDTINRVARNPSSIGNRTDNSNYSLISF